MAHVNARLAVKPEIIEQLSTEKAGFWTAAHKDGSDERFNFNELNNAIDVTPEVGIMDIGLQFVRKLFRDSTKTKEDFDAEKEAAKINKTCGALEEMLREYLLAAREGSVDEESLDELIDTLAEMHGYDQAGLLSLPGEKELADIRKSVSVFTASLAKEKGEQSVPEADDPNADEFTLIRDQLIQQRKLIG